MRRLALFFALSLGFAVLLPSARAATNDPLRERQWNLDKIGAEAAWTVANGTGITVAVVDSGVDFEHEDLQGKLLPGHDFVENDDVAQDAFGHGTHVAGLIGAATGNGRGIAGVAPGVKLLPVRVLDDKGEGEADAVVAGIRWAISHGANVVNLSLGNDFQSVFGPNFTDAVRDAWSAGIVCVVSAGNQLPSSGFTDEPAIVVSATTRDDQSPTYANGVGEAKWGMAAPGGELPTLGEDNAILSSYWVSTAHDEYAYLAGTSQAAPHVSAAVAILLSTGKFTPVQAVQRLLETAKDVGTPGHDTLFGYGRLDLAAATRGLDAASSGSPSTTAGAAGGGPGTTATAGASTTALPLPSLASPTVLPDRPVDATVAAGPQVTVGGAGTWEHHRTGRTVPTVIAALVLVAATAGAMRWWRGRLTDDPSPP
jgi:subtilisin family serine protease